MQSLVATLVAALLVGMPAIAAACPACVGQQASLSTTLKLLGVFILFPFFVVALVLKAIRQAQRESRDKD